MLGAFELFVVGGGRDRLVLDLDEVLLGFCISFRGAAGFGLGGRRVLVRGEAVDALGETAGFVKKLAAEQVVESPFEIAAGLLEDVTEGVVSELVAEDQPELLDFLVVTQVCLSGECLVFGQVREVRDIRGRPRGRVEAVAAAGGFLEAPRVGVGGGVGVGAAQPRRVKPGGCFCPRRLGQLVQNMPNSQIIRRQVSVIGDEVDQ